MSQHHLSAVKHIIGVHSAKGGVGKSTVALNLAVALAAKGAKTGLLDADIHGPSIALMMGNRDWPDPVGSNSNEILPLEAHGVKFISMGNLVTKQTPLIWRGAMVHQMLSQLLRQVVWGELDYLIIDMPPGTGDAILSLGQLVTLSGAVTVTTPQALSVADTARGLNSFHLLKVPVLGLLENMSYFRCDDCEDEVFLFGDGGGEAMSKALKLPLLGQIPLEPHIVATGDKGRPLVLAFPDSESARVLTAAAAKIEAELSARQGARGILLQWREMGFAERNAAPPQNIQHASLPVKALWQVSTDELGILWDGDESVITAVRALRLRCPCAGCVDELTGKRTLKDTDVPQSVTLVKAESVGQYALAFHFSDGHGTGIYPYALLREITLPNTQAAVAE